MVRATDVPEAFVEQVQYAMDELPAGADREFGCEFMRKGIAATVMGGRRGWKSGTEFRTAAIRAGKKAKDKQAWLDFIEAITPFIVALLPLLVKA